MQQQQHLMQMQPIMAAYYNNNVTSDHIQQYLDENKSLILKIVESQNSGKLSECAENQARLQRNLMYLAAIADSQPQPPAMHTQFPSGGMMQAGAHYLQHQQAQPMTTQSVMAAWNPMLYAQQSHPFLQQHQALHSQLGMSSASTSGLHMLQSDTSNTGGFPEFGRGSGLGMAGGIKHDVGSSGGQGGSGSGDGGENLYLKSSDDGN